MDTKNNNLLFKVQMVAAKIWTSRKLTQKKLKVEINFY